MTEHLTPRLRLSLLVLQDWPDWRTLFRDPQVLAALGHDVWTDDFLKTRFEWALTQISEHGYGLWMIRTREDNAFVGRIMLRPLEVEGTTEMEIGWSCVAPQWGKGYATEAAREILHYGLNTLHMPSIVACTRHSNTKSQRVMDKLTMRFEREAVVMGEPHLLYRATR